MIKSMVIMMTFNQYKYLILSDLYRHTGRVSFFLFLRYLFFGESYKYIFWMRTCLFLQHNIVLKLFVYPIARLILWHYTYKFGISIPYRTDIKSGFYIGHFGTIVVNGNSSIGINCNISPGVIIGQSNRGNNKGCPTIGDNVYIGPGVKIIGAIKIGNNVAIGANCVVLKNVPDNSVVVGVPGKVISYKGSEGYIVRTNYENILGKMT